MLKSCQTHHEPANAQEEIYKKSALLWGVYQLQAYESSPQPRSAAAFGIGGEPLTSGPASLGDRAREQLTLLVQLGERSATVRTGYGTR
jgi:hypothetical protein